MLAKAIYEEILIEPILSRAFFFEAHIPLINLQEILKEIMILCACLNLGESASEIMEDIDWTTSLRTN